MKVALYARYSTDSHATRRSRTRFASAEPMPRNRDGGFSRNIPTTRFPLRRFCVPVFKRSAPTWSVFSSESSHYVNESAAPTPARQDDYSDVRFRLPDDVDFVFLEELQKSAHDHQTPTPDGSRSELSSPYQFVKLRPSQARGLACFIDRTTQPLRKGNGSLFKLPRR